MAFIAKLNKDDYVLPPAGLCRAMCSEVVDLGEVDTQFGRKHQGRFIFEIDFTNPNTGKRVTAVQTFNVSLHRKSQLRDILHKWLGRELAPAEAANFDLDKMVGVPAILQIEHATSQTSGNKYAKISTIAPHQNAFGEPLKLIDNSAANSGAEDYSWVLG